MLVGPTAVLSPVLSLATLSLSHSSPRSRSVPVTMRFPLRWVVTRWQGRGQRWPASLRRLARAPWRSS